MPPALLRSVPSLSTNYCFSQLRAVVRANDVSCIITCLQAAHFECPRPQARRRFFLTHPPHPFERYGCFFGKIVIFCLEL